MKVYWNSLVTLPLRRSLRSVCHLVVQGLRDIKIDYHSKVIANHIISFHTKRKGYPIPFILNESKICLTVGK